MTAKPVYLVEIMFPFDVNLLFFIFYVNQMHFSTAGETLTLQQAELKLAALHWSHSLSVIQLISLL